VLVSKHMDNLCAEKNDGTVVVVTVVVVVVVVVVVFKLKYNVDVYQNCCL